jgi:CheY-like chemotaxis protein
VVIADFKMPGMDGMTFLEKALQSDPWNVRDPGDRILFGGFGD